MDKTAAAIIQTSGKWLVPVIVIFLLWLFTLAYFNTKPGSPVKVFGYEVVDRPLDEITINIQHYLTRTNLVDAREEINLVILNKSTVSSVSSKEGELKTIQIYLLRQDDMYFYTISGKFEHRSGSKVIQGVGEILFEDNGIYYFKKSDAENGNGWVYEIIPSE